MARVKHHNRGYRQLRSDPGIVAKLEDISERTASRANNMMGEGPGHFVTGSRQGRARPQGRWRTSVVTATWKAKYYQAKTNALLKALYG